MLAQPPQDWRSVANSTHSCSISAHSASDFGIVEVGFTGHADILYGHRMESKLTIAVCSFISRGAVRLRSGLPEGAGARRGMPDGPGARRTMPEGLGSRRGMPEGPGARRPIPEGVGARRLGGVPEGTPRAAYAAGEAAATKPTMAERTVRNRATRILNRVYKV